MRLYVVYVVNAITRMLETCKDFEKISDAIRYARNFEKMSFVETKIRVLTFTQK